MPAERARAVGLEVERARNTTSLTFRIVPLQYKLIKKERKQYG